MSLAKTIASGMTHPLQAAGQAGWINVLTGWGKALLIAVIVGSAGRAYDVCASAGDVESSELIPCLKVKRPTWLQAEEGIHQIGALLSQEHLNVVQIDSVASLDLKAAGQASALSEIRHLFHNGAVDNQHGAQFQALRGIETGLAGVDRRGVDDGRKTVAGSIQKHSAFMLKIIETDGLTRPVRIERRRGKWERDSDVLLVEIALSGGFAVFIEVIAKGWKEIKKLRRQSQFGFSAGQSHRARAAESLGGNAKRG